MTSAKDQLYAHLADGSTSVCQAWRVVRLDGTVYGFTDHDQDLSFDGVTYRASTGMTARALQKSLGMAVDNSEAIGALSASAITEADLIAGRFDGAVVQSWLVNWANPAERVQQFQGSFGEIQRGAGAFRAELRGLTEDLNRPQGLVYQKQCSAVLGDGRCRFDLAQPGFAVEVPLVERLDVGTYRLTALPSITDNWFERGRMVFLSGPAQGLIALVRSDKTVDGDRIIEVFGDVGAVPGVGDMLRLEAGCDKIAATCREKFNNFINFRGFPDLPGEDWLTSYPVSSQVNNGGSLVR